MILLRHFCIIFLVLFQHLLGWLRLPLARLGIIQTGLASALAASAFSDARIAPLQILQYNSKI